MTRPRALTLEPLEDRTTPATFGIPWQDPGHLTLSFAPDGTPVAGQVSTLFQTLDAVLPTAVWQREVLRAFQTWAVYGNLDVSVRADGGQAFGTAGRLQGDPRFGDIRVGARPMPPDVLSVSVPYDPFTSGTLAGDVFLNSNYAFDAASLFAVLLHEAGHVLGLDDSPDPASAMYPRLTFQTQPAPGDVAALQALYGVRAPDPHEGRFGNETPATATALHPAPGSHGPPGSAPLVAFGDVTTGADADVYSVRTTASYRGPVTFRAQAAGRSALAPRLTVYDAAGRVVGEASGDPCGVATVRLAQAQPNALYYAKVQGATGDVFGVGGYGLAVTFDAALAVAPDAADRVLRGPYETLSADDIDSLLRDPTQTFFNDDRHSNDTIERATALRTRPGHAARTVFDVVASLSDAADVDFYRLDVAPDRLRQARALTVTLWGINDAGVVPQAAVWTAERVLLPAEVLVNGYGLYAIQVTDPPPTAGFYVRVAAPAGAGGGAGNYVLHVYLSPRAADLDTFAAGTLDATAAEQRAALYVGQSQLFQFVLSADAAGAPAGAAVRLTVYDADGAELLRLVARAGDVVSGPGLFLGPGAYTVVFSAESPDGDVPALAFRLRGKNLTDPIGPALDDPTFLPMYSSPTEPSVFQYPDDILSLSPFLFISLVL